MKEPFYEFIASSVLMVVVVVSLSFLLKAMDMPVWVAPLACGATGGTWAYFACRRLNRRERENLAELLKKARRL